MIPPEKPAYDFSPEEEAELVAELDALERGELETVEGKDALAQIRATIEAIRKVVA